MNSPRLLTVADLATRLSLSERQLRRHLSTGKTPAPIRVGRLIRFRPEDIDAWIAMGCPSRVEFEARLRYATTPAKASPARGRVVQTNHRKPEGGSRCV